LTEFRPISLFIQPVYRQNRPVGDFTVQILNQMDFGQFGRFFRKPAGSEGADFLVSAGFLNTACILSADSVFNSHKFLDLSYEYDGFILRHVDLLQFDSV
jgi:hypothetical protein